MRKGYLLIETNPAHPGLIRLCGVDSYPKDFPANLAYVARFSDIDAALMHFHSGLRRSLVDVDKRLYRAPETDAVAVAEAIALPRRRIYLDPTLAKDPDLVSAVARKERIHHLNKLLFDLVGIVALLALLATALIGI